MERVWGVALQGGPLLSARGKTTRLAVNQQRPLVETLTEILWLWCRCRQTSAGFTQFISQCGASMSFKANFAAPPLLLTELVDPCLPTVSDPLTNPYCNEIRKEKGWKRSKQQQSVETWRIKYQVLSWCLSPAGRREAASSPHVHLCFFTLTTPKVPWGLPSSLYIYVCVFTKPMHGVFWSTDALLFQAFQGFRSPFTNQAVKPIKLLGGRWKLEPGPRFTSWKRNLLLDRQDSGCTFQLFLQHVTLLRFFFKSLTFLMPLVSY